MRLHGYNIYVTEYLYLLNKVYMKVNCSKDYRFNESGKYTYNEYSDNNR